MAYTPELSRKYSGELRRIAWALGMPMTKALEEILDYVGNALKSSKVCEACRDDAFCEHCLFNRS